MKVLSFAALSAALTMAASFGHAKTITVEAGTNVQVELMENVHSSFNTKGELLYLQATQDVLVDGVIAIPKGALVEARIGNAKGTGMMGPDGGVSFHPLQLGVGDDKWLWLVPSNFGDETGRPGFVARGTTYTVTIRDDSKVATHRMLRERKVRAAAVSASGAVEPLKPIKPKKSRFGRDIKVQLKLASGMASLAPTRPRDVRVVSFNGYVPEEPVYSTSIRVDRRGNVRATFDWWSIVRYAQPGRNALVAQFRLSDARLAQADLTMETTWEWE